MSYQPNYCLLKVAYLCVLFVFLSCCLNFPNFGILIHDNDCQIDSIMSTRTSNENEASRRLKSEFLIQFDGVTTTAGDLVIVIGKIHLCTFGF